MTQSGIRAGWHFFDGLQARWFAQVNLPKGLNVHKKGRKALTIVFLTTCLAACSQISQ
jgi:hypothetical protein